MNELGSKQEVEEFAQVLSALCELKRHRVIDAQELK
nr:MAG TPA: hypothetical protein [Caudoviricetes sp.]